MPTANAAAALREVREREFPFVRECTYLNGAEQGPLPARTAQVVGEVAAASQAPGTPRLTTLPPYERLARERLARLIGAEPGDIAFTSNTTHGMNIAVQGITWRAGDNLVVPQHEFPSLTTAMLHLRTRGVEVRFVPFSGPGPSVDDIMARVDSRTRGRVQRRYLEHWLPRRPRRARRAVRQRGLPTDCGRHSTGRRGPGGCQSGAPLHPRNAQL
jgi:selenocysteine lyase/cysteine desulfurase